MNTIKTKLHNYSFDISNPAEKAAWQKLCAKLTAKGLECFKTWGGGSHYKRELGATKTVHLETSHLFNNQWNTAPIKGVSDKGLRVFDWAEDANVSGFCAKNMMRGHYLTQTAEMKSARDNTTACGYCGKQEPAQKGYAFCPHCIDSEYLEVNNLYLLRMKTVSDTTDRAQLTEAESAHLLPLFKQAKLHGVTERGKARIAAKRASLQKSYEKAVYVATTERDGFTWLMDNGLNTDNVIYYDHTDCFTFGWRNPVADEIVSDILDIISEFPFDYEIKCADGRELSN